MGMPDPGYVREREETGESKFLRTLRRVEVAICRGISQAAADRPELQHNSTQAAGRLQAIPVTFRAPVRGGGHFYHLHRFTSELAAENEVVTKDGVVRMNRLRRTDERGYVDVVNSNVAAFTSHRDSAGDPQSYDRSAGYGTRTGHDEARRDWDQAASVLRDYRDDNPQEREPPWENFWDARGLVPGEPR